MVCAHPPSRVPSPHQIRWALAITTALTVLEVAGAWKSGSMALWGEAAHFVADVWAFGVALFALSSAPAHSRLSYGRGQAIALGGLINGLLQGAIGAVVAWGAWRRFAHPQPIEGGWMLAVAMLGFGFNLVLLRRFSGAHMHEDDAIEGARIHFIADAGLCGATVLAALVVSLGGPVWADAVLALLAAGLMVLTAVRLIRRVGAALLAGSPQMVVIPTLLADLNTLPEVTSAHHLHVWSVGHQVMGSVHVQCLTSSGPLLREAEAVMRRHGVTHSTIQVETHCPNPDCSQASSGIVANP
jgi:cobalt-zinc-cadmium efflux system protein